MKLGDASRRVVVSTFYNTKKNGIMLCSDFNNETQYDNRPDEMRIKD